MLLLHGVEGLECSWYQNGRTHHVIYRVMLNVAIAFYWCKQSVEMEIYTSAIYKVNLKYSKSGTE